MKKGLTERMADGEFVVSIQIDPPGVDTDITNYWEDIKTLRASGIEVVDINSSRRSSYDSIFLASILAKMGFETVPHVTTRDSSVDGLINLIFPAFKENGVAHFLIVTGDPREKKHSKSPSKKLRRGVYQTDAVGALGVLDEHLRKKAGFHIALAGAVNQNSAELCVEGDRIRQKENAGANFFMSQPIFSEAQMWDLLEFYRSWSKKPLIVGIWPIVSAKTLKKVYEGAVEGVVFPKEEYGEVKKRAAHDGVMKTCGVDKAILLIKMLQDTKKVSGVYVVAPSHNPLLSLDIVKNVC